MRLDESPFPTFPPFQFQSITTDTSLHTNSNNLTNIEEFSSRSTESVRLIHYEFIFYYSQKEEVQTIHSSITYWYYALFPTLHVKW